MAPQPDLLDLATSYCTIRVCSAPAVLITYTVVGWFIGGQNTRWTLLIVLLTNLANVGLDVLLVIGLDMRSDGAALATVSAEYLGCLFAVLAVAARHPRIHMFTFKADLLNVSAYSDLLRSNRHLFIRTVSLLFAFAFFTAQGDNLGSEVLAANTLMMHLVMLAAYAMDGFAFAAEGLSGQYLGAGNLAAFFRGVRRCALWTALAAGAASLGLLLLQPVLIASLSSIGSIQELMSDYFVWIIMLPPLAASAYLLDGVFVGAAETRYMMDSMLASLLLVYLPLWYLTRGWSNHGLWLAFSAFNVARGISLYHCFRKLSLSGGWLGSPAT